MSSSVTPKLETSSLARFTRMILMNLLFTRLPIFKSNWTAIIFLSSCRYFFLNSSVLAISKDEGGEIFTVLFRNCESAVAAAPIIWFITSQMAPIFISSSSNSLSEKSVCSRRPTIVLTSSRFRIRILLPERPSVYFTSTPTAGS